MGPRNLLILFFSTVAVSLVILIIFFSLFFKNVDLNFNTRLPESAPDIGSLYGGKNAMNPDSKADGLLRSTVNVPTESHEPPPTGREETKTEPSDTDLPPVSDDIMLQDSEPPVPSATQKAETSVPASGQSKAPARKVERSPAPQQPEPIRPELEPLPDIEPSGPPVPTQGNATPETNYRVVMSGFATREEADAAATRASAAGANPIVKKSGNAYHVQLGSFSSRKNAESLAERTGASVRKVD